MEISLSVCENTTLALREAGRGDGMRVQGDMGVDGLEEFLERKTLATVIS
jgi:hypothetical protein